MPGTHDASALLEAALSGNLNLDTGAEHQPDATSTTTAATETNDTEQAQQGAPAGDDNGTQAQGTEQPAPIASKSGAYTIPYDKLVEARTERDTLKQRNAELEQQLQQMSAQQQSNLQQAQQAAQERASQGEGATQADANLAVAQAAMAQGVDMDLFGDFSEGAIAKGIAQMVAMQVQQQLAPMREQESQKAKQTAQQAHLSAIYGAHPDADEIVESGQWNQWLAGLPAFMRAATEQTMSNGSAQQINEVFSTFKQQAGIGGGNPSVDALVKQAKFNPPNTLTDVPGGLVAKSEAEQLAAAAGDSSSLLSMFEGKSAEEIERLMDKVL